MTRKEINKLKAEKVKTSFCIACNKTYPKEKFQISPCRKSKNGLKSWCNWCLRNRPHSKGLKNGRKRSIEYFAKKRAKANERTVKRRTSARNYVMPKWANKEKIKEIYKQANMRQEFEQLAEHLARSLHVKLIQWDETPSPSKAKPGNHADSG